MPEDIIQKDSRDRRIFTNWLVKYFIEAPKTNNPILPDELLNVFSTQHPGTTLTEKEITDMLFAMGYMNSKYPTLRIDVNMDTIKTFDINAILAFNKAEWSVHTKTAIRILVLQKRESQKLQKAGLTKDDIADINTCMLQEFYDKWCFNMKTFPGADKVDVHYKHAIVARVKKCYKYFCKLNHYQELSWKVVKTFLIVHGHTPGLGYTCKRSGQSYFHWLYVPGSYDDDEFTKSVQIGRGIMHQANCWFLTNGYCANSYQELLNHLAQIRSEDEDEEVITHEEVAASKETDTGTDIRDIPDNLDAHDGHDDLPTGKRSVEIKEQIIPVGIEEKVPDISTDLSSETSSKANLEAISKSIKPNIDDKPISIQPIVEFENPETERILKNLRISPEEVNQYKVATNETEVVQKVSSEDAKTNHEKLVEEIKRGYVPGDVTGQPK